MHIDHVEVDRAFELGEFSPHFQPLVSLRTGGLYGFELLARWRHPQQGWIPPDEFIPVAERDGWIDRLSRELFDKGFAAIAALPGSLTLSINISSAQLYDPALPEMIGMFAKSAGFPVDRLVVEITESALGNKMESARKIVQALKAMGARLALDDFGTGCSSLSHLQSLPFDELKVDRSFVGSMTEQPDSREIVSAVVGLGQSLGLTTVAEGIETAEQAEMLQWLGCEMGQGWLYGRPVPAERLGELVEGGGGRIPPGLPGKAARQDSTSTLNTEPSQRLAQLQTVYDGAPVGLAFLDREMRYRNLNQRLANMHGRPMEEHLGRTVKEMIPELFPQVEPFIRRALNGEVVPAVEITNPASSPNGDKTILLSYDPVRDEAGEVVGVSAAIVVLTPIQQAEAARQEGEAHFRHRVELLPQIPWIVDPEGRGLEVSQRCLELTGATHEEWGRAGWIEALHPDDVAPTLAAMEIAFATQSPIDVVFRVRKSEDEPWRSLRSRGALRIGEDGKAVCWYGCLEQLEKLEDLERRTNWPEGANSSVTD